MLDLKCCLAQVYIYDSENILVVTDVEFEYVLSDSWVGTNNKGKSLYLDIGLKTKFKQVTYTDSTYTLNQNTKCRYIIQ